MRLEYEWHVDAGQWWRAYDNENREFDALGYMRRRFASIKDLAIAEADRRLGAPPSGCGFTPCER